MIDAQRAAERFIGAMQGRDCAGLWSLLSAGTRRVLEEAGGDGRAQLCEAMATEAIPPMSVRGPARPDGSGGAEILIESDGDVETLALVVEEGRWVVDLLASMGGDDGGRSGDRTSSEAVKETLSGALDASGRVLDERGRYTDDVDELSAREPAFAWRSGVAPASATAGDVHVAVADDGRVVCLSARADNGARFMIKRVVGETPSYAGGEIPAVCDATPLGRGW